MLCVDNRAIMTCLARNRTKSYLLLKTLRICFLSSPSSVGWTRKSPSRNSFTVGPDNACNVKHYVMEYTQIVDILI